jgi:uncharacterized phiE125 gp8 family phage protein
MSLKLLTAPTVEPLSILEANEHLRIDVDEDTGLVQNLIITARQYCEKFQNRAYLDQSWELWLDAFPDVDYIVLPLPPLISVTSIKYYGTDNTEYTAYEPGALVPVGVADYFVDTKSEPGKIALNYGKSWPSTALRSYNAVCVTFKAGYGTTAAALGENVKAAIKLMVSHLYEHRGDSDKPVDIPPVVQNLLWQERVF